MENQLQSSEELVRFGIDPRLQACFGEINEVLRKHQLEGRIALKVIHSHFDIASDEALFETSDPERRELLLTPVKKSELKPEDVFISEVDPLSLRPLTFCPFKLRGCKCTLCGPRK
ncbi:MAG: hypothetical protein MN733_26450 [Nitrososphaera sp.]|nr:hypothetical protein [Nitrososphaera sp.]